MPVLIPISLRIWAREANEIADGLDPLIRDSKYESTLLMLGAAHNALRLAAVEMTRTAEWWEKVEGAKK